MPIVHLTDVIGWVSGTACDQLRLNESMIMIDSDRAGGIQI